jgi:hypothetical protein
MELNGAFLCKPKALSDLPLPRSKMKRLLSPGEPVGFEPFVPGTD